MDHSRRETFRTLSKLALAGGGIYLLSKLPRVNAQTSEIDVGVLQVPVTLDGQVEKAEWYSDSIDYQASGFQLVGTGGPLTPGPVPHFHFRGKFDESYVYFGFDAPTSTFMGGENQLWLVFDTKGTGSYAAGSLGVYNLLLQPSSDSFYETSTPFEGSSFPGTPFFKLFTRGQDYDWQSYWGSSPLSSDLHLQFEFKFRTSIVKKYGNQIGIGVNLNSNPNPGCGLSCPIPGYAALSHNWFMPMVFKEHAIPEFDSETAVLLSSLVGAVVATRLAKKRLSRRDLFRVH